MFRDRNLAGVCAALVLCSTHFPPLMVLTVQVSPWAINRVGKVNRVVGIYVVFSLLPRNDLLKMRDTSPAMKNNSGAGFISLKSSTDNRGLGCL